MQCARGMCLRVRMMEGSARASLQESARRHGRRRRPSRLTFIAGVAGLVAAASAAAGAAAAKAFAAGRLGAPGAAAAEASPSDGVGRLPTTASEGAGSFTGPAHRSSRPGHGGHGHWAASLRSESRTVATAAWAPALAGVSPPLLSGVWEAMSTIFVSEVGDKTFFLTMILAARRGRIMALASATTALWSMTAMSATIGVALRSFESGVSSVPLVKVAAALLMFVFGFQSLRGGPNKSEEGAECDADEKGEAECEIDGMLQKGGRKNIFIDYCRFTALIFLAEWGDRSMFATVALAAARSPFGVFVGGCMGHSVAACLAVLSGGLMEKYISDRAVRLASGVLFIAFGITTLIGIY